MSTESPTTLPAETHTLNDCQREGHYHIDTIGHPAERLCHCPKLGRIICAISFSRPAASPSDAAEIVAEMARDAEGQISTCSKAISAALREAERRIRAKKD